MGWSGRYPRTSPPSPLSREERGNQKRYTNHGGAMGKS